MTKEGHMEERTIYGDGTTAVTVGDKVTIWRDDVLVLRLSRPAFREIVLGWERLQEQEDE